MGGRRVCALEDEQISNGGAVESVQLKIIQIC